jgi:hypothetical protein
MLTLEVICDFHAPVALSRGESLQHLLDCSKSGQSSEEKISFYYQESNSGIVIILIELFQFLIGLQKYPKDD